MVVIHLTGEKKGAVDVVIKDALDRFRSAHFDETTPKKQMRIAVLICGDSDFSSNIKRVQQCGLRTVVIYTPNKTTPGFLDLIPSSLALGSWEELIDESEMDASDISIFSQRLSFRFKKRSFVAPSSTVQSEKIDSLNTENDEMVLSIYETNIPDFKFQCAKDLYRFLLKQQNVSIDATDLIYFWESFPNHRNEIGKISNFCQSAKAEGAFLWSINKASNTYVLRLNPPNLRKQSIAFCNSVHINRGNFTNGRRKSIVALASNGIPIQSEDRDIASTLYFYFGIFCFVCFLVIIYLIISIFITCLFIGIPIAF